MCFPERVEVACWAGRSVVLLTSGHRCRLEGRLEACFALRPRAFRQAPPIFSVVVTIIAGPLSLLTCAQGSQLTVVPLWCVLLRHIPPPVAFWSLIFWRGLFRSVPGGPAIFLHIVPMVNDCLFVPLGPRAFDSATLGHYL